MENLPETEVHETQIESAEPVVQEEVKEKELMRFACRKCRKILFDETVFEQHTSTAKRIYTRKDKKGNN